MKNHPYKLLVVDIDGTLLDAKGNISPLDEKALSQARDSGIKISLCTGRSILASLKIIHRLSLDGNHIFFDGALVRNPSRGKEIYAKPISKSLVKQLIQYAHAHNLNLELFSVSHFFVERESWATEVRRQFFGIEATVVDFTSLWKGERIIKAGMVTTTPEEVAQAEEFRRHFKGALNFSYARTPAYPGVDFINILARGVSKGKALEALASHLGISLSEVIAVGDGSNDIPLLTAAGLAVAMGNAPEEVKAVADYITLDVNQSGLASAINRFLL